MFLAAALTIPAAVPVAASESTADKEETVYVKTDANGEEKTVIVSDWLKNFSGEAKIKDATDLPFPMTLPNTYLSPSLRPKRAEAVLD